MICAYEDNIYVPAGGYIWMVDLLNNYNVAVYAGTGITGKASDGARLSAAFINSQSCQFDIQGNLWIGDSTLVRVIDTSGYLFVRERRT